MIRKKCPYLSPIFHAWMEITHYCTKVDKMVSNWKQEDEMKNDNSHCKLYGWISCAMGFLFRNPFLLWFLTG